VRKGEEERKTKATCGEVFWSKKNKGNKRRVWTRWHVDLQNLEKRHGHGAGRKKKKDDARDTANRFWDRSVACHANGGEDRRSLNATKFGGRGRRRQRKIRLPAKGPSCL